MPTKYDSLEYGAYYTTDVAIKKWGSLNTEIKPTD